MRSVTPAFFVKTLAAFVSAGVCACSSAEQVSPNLGMNADAGSLTDSGSAPILDGSGGSDASNASDGAAGVDAAPACTGAFVKAPDVQIALAPNAAGYAAWTGSGYGVLWSTSGGDLAFAATDPHGAVSSSSSVLATGAGASLLVWNGTTFMASYSAPDSTNAGDAYLLGLGPSGTALGAAQVIYSDVGGSVATSAVAWSGSQYLTFFEHGGLVARQLVGSSGQPIGSTMPLGDTQGGMLVLGGYPAATWAGDRYAAMWAQTAGQAGNIAPPGFYFAEFAADGTASPAISVWQPPSPLTQATYWSTIAWTGSEYRLAWGDGDFYSTRLSRGGSPDPVAHYVVGGSNEVVSAPAWDGTNYGALITSGTGFAFQRISPAGVAVGAPISISTSLLYANLTWTGREYAIVWSDAQALWLTRIGGCP
jgi:hypothetical protein